MKLYYVNKNPQIRGEHEVHSRIASTCQHLKIGQYLGILIIAPKPLKRTRKFYANVDGVSTAVPQCHTK